MGQVELVQDSNNWRALTLAALHFKDVLNKL